VKILSCTPIKDLIFNLCYRMLIGVRCRRWNPEDMERALWNISKRWRWFKTNVLSILCSKSHLEKALRWKELFCNTGRNCFSRKLNWLPLLTNLHLKRLEKKKTRIFNSSWKFKTETAKESSRTIYCFRQISVLWNVRRDFSGEHDLCMSCKKCIHEYCAGIKQGTILFLLQLHYWFQT
jgi:hypothetical protein